MWWYGGTDGGLFHFRETITILTETHFFLCFQNVCAFIISAYSSNYLRLNKPFNPLLGETFEYEIASAQTKVMLEQVSHHPPISALYAESPHFTLKGSVNPKLRFWGKSIEVKPEGSLTLKLKKKGETYTWKSISCCVHNIIVGKLWFEQVSPYCKISLFEINILYSLYFLYLVWQCWSNQPR